MQKTTYPKQPDKARCTLYAISGGRRIRVQGATLEAVMLRLRELCPGGHFRELREGRA